MRLNEAAMLVTLHQRAWKGRVSDRDVAYQTEESLSSEHGTITVIKDLTPRRFLKPIYNLMQLGRTQHYNMTVPGLVRGQHLMAAAMWWEYMEVQKQIRTAFWSAVDNFIDEYPSIVESAPDRLAGAYKRGDFPSQETIRTFFDYDVQFQPVPRTEDWRIQGIGEDETEALRDRLSKEIGDMYKSATEEVFERAKDVLERIAKQAGQYTGGPGSTQLRNATIENMQEVASLIRRMNVTGDADLDEVGSEMEAMFENITGDELRSDGEKRAKITEDAQKILDRINKR